MLTPRFLFLRKNNTVIIAQPPFSPDLGTCDFCWSPKLKRTSYRHAHIRSAWRIGEDAGTRITLKKTKYVYIAEYYNIFEKK